MKSMILFLLAALNVFLIGISVSTFAVALNASAVVLCICVGFLVAEK